MHWDSNDCAIAPSPIVRTYRPDPVKRKAPKMTASVSNQGSLSPKPRGSVPRPQARSAGTAERPGRNESLVDLVRFFQTQNMAAQIIASTPTPPQPESSESLPIRTPSSPSDTTTALPVALSPKEPKLEPKPEPKLEPKQDLKPFHRRLLQFAQRPKKDASVRSKKEEQQRQIEALTREGYLIPPPLPKESKSQKEANQSKESLSLSVSRSLSKSRRDVENIGQPWLQPRTEGRIEPRNRRLASIDLDDFGSMVDVAVSLTTEFDDAVPPPYQPTEGGPSQTSSMELGIGSTGSASPPTAVRPQSSIASTSHSYRNVSIDEQIRQPPTTAQPSDVPATSRKSDIDSAAQPSQGTAVKTPPSQPRASCDSVRRDQSDQSSVRNVTPSQPTLRLFPDVAPPRKSSVGALKASAVPRYQIAHSVAGSSSSKSSPKNRASDNTTEPSTTPRKSSDVFADVSAGGSEPNSTGALVPRADSTAPASVGAATEAPTSPSQVKTRRTSLSMGTLNSFPLPAPTRPLPSLPEVGRSSGALPDTSVRPEVMPNSHSFSSLPNEKESVSGSPRTHDSRPPTSLDSVGAGGSIADDEESLFAASISGQSKPTPGLYTTRGRASSVRIPRVQDSPETPTREKGQPLADSPVLGHGTPTKPHGKRVPTTLKINPQLARNNLPFGLPSPPPTASLPSAPPGLKSGQRSATAPHTAKLSSMKSMEVPTGPGSYRNSMISRSDSSRSSLRNESFPDSYEDGQTQSRAQSAIASSDDEVFGPTESTRSSRREPTKHKRLQTVRREHDSMDVNQSSSRSRLRFPQHSELQSHRNSSYESIPSPSNHSQMSHRSRESHNSRSHAPPTDHYLEDRVANLERQNQMLQAALMAALNASGKNPLEGLNIDTNHTPSFQNAPYVHQYAGRHSSRDSWVSSCRSSEHSGFETSSPKGGRADVKQFDTMIEDIESGWMSDKSNLSGRIVHKR